MTGARRGFFNGACAATVFLTRVPLPERLYGGPHPWRWAVPWFPVVGAAIGTILAALWHWRGALPDLPAAVLVVAASLLLTGALHEDGLADTADALGGAHSRERIVEILKDSRVGSYGALALICSVTLRVTLLATMQRGAEVALVMSHMLGRTAAISILTTLPYVTPTEVSRSRGLGNRGWRDGVLGWTGTLIIAGGVACLSSLTLLAAAAIVLVSLALTLACRAYFLSRMGGTTGDFLGAAEQVSECGVLLACAMTFGRPT